MNQDEFRAMMLKRTRVLAILVIRMVNEFPSNTAYWVIGKQVLKSATSLAANYYATNRSRSKKEFYAKLCIVVEECDETLFWLQLLEEAELVESTKIGAIKTETTELLKILAKSKKSTKEGIYKT
ncbi:MAG: four helix bundle protein [Bacteroidota bacterium]